jgi:VanZ family protein
MHQKIHVAAMVICLAFIVYATLTKMAGRPAFVGHDEAIWIVEVERFSAYALLGLLLATLLPGRGVAAGALVVGLAILLEVLQTFIPTRDPSIHDVIQKAAGGITGVLLAQLVLMFLPRPPY